MWGWNNALPMGQSAQSCSGVVENRLVSVDASSPGGHSSTPYRATALPGVGDLQARYNSHSRLQARYSSRSLFSASFVFHEYYLLLYFYFYSYLFLPFKLAAMPRRRGSTRGTGAPVRGTPGRGSLRSTPGRQCHTTSRTPGSQSHTTSRAPGSQSHTTRRTPGRQSHTRIPGTPGSEGSRKIHAAALGAKLQALIAAILPLSTPLPVLQVAKVETKRQATIETPLTIIAPYPLPSHKRVPQ